MIQKLTINNFLSFTDEVNFSFEASNDKFAEDYQVVKINDNTRLLRFAIIYGYNASGKSNLLKAFQFLNFFWFNDTEDLDQNTKVEPFELDIVSINEPSVFDLVFIVENIKYRYQLELDKNQVYFEKLSYYETTQPIKLFERVLKDNKSLIIFGSDLKLNKTTKQLIDGYCLNNMSFFAARKKVNATIPFVDSVRKYMKTMVMGIITPDTKLTEYAKKKISNNNSLLSYLLSFLRNADFNVTNIKTKVSKKDVPEELRNIFIKDSNLPDNVKKDILSNNVYMEEMLTLFEHTVENERGVETYTLSLDNGQESDGTVRIFGLETALYNALTNNAFLAVDEIETSLHPKLLERMIFEFLKTSSTSQLIVTTHNDGLLDLINNLIRKDSVWFTEKQKSGVTDLYKLTDFRGVNRLSSIREAYRNKRFGATMN